MLAIAAKTFHRRALCLHCKYLRGVTVIDRETLQSLCQSKQELQLKSALQHCTGVVKNVNHTAAAPVLHRQYSSSAVRTSVSLLYGKNM